VPFPRRFQAPPGAPSRLTGRRKKQALYHTLQRLRRGAQVTSKGHHQVRRDRRVRPCRAKLTIGVATNHRQLPLWNR